MLGALLQSQNIYHQITSFIKFKPKEYAREEAGAGAMALS
jgi:hypothetical protein